MSTKLTRSPLSRLGAWWFGPLPRGRVAALRTFVYGFIFLDLFVLRPWVSVHGDVPPELYHPLFITNFLPMPTPTPLTVGAIQAALIVSCAVALTGRWPRLAGALVFVFYLQWMLVAFSYGKVDHDRVAFLVALAVLPTAGPARWGDTEADEAAGFAIRSIQVAVVITYFASVLAKIRFGGLNWATGSTFLRAIIRRGTFLAEPLVSHPAILKLGQFTLIAFELLSPLLLAPGRIGLVMLGIVVIFHLVTYSGIGIMFWPHVLCLLAFVPLERLNPREWVAIGRARQQARGAVVD